MDAQRPDVSLLDLGRKISFDPMLSALIIKACRAPAFGITQPVKSPLHAVALLGLENTRQIVASYVARAVVSDYSRRGEELWKHLLTVAYAAQNIARLRKIDVDMAELFTAGLFHDLGKTAFLSDKEYEFLGKNRQERLAFEREKYGRDHVEITLQMARDWPVSEDIKKAIEEHHRSDGKDLNSLSGLLVLAHHLIYQDFEPLKEFFSEKEIRWLEEMYLLDLEGVKVFFEG